MVKKIGYFIVILVIFQNCNRSPVSVAEEDYGPPQDTIVEKVVTIRINNDPYSDTIVKSTVVDSTNDTTGEVDFLIDIKNAQFGINGLRKTLLDRVKLTDNRIDSINAVTFQFVSLDSKDTINKNYPVVNGVCSVKTVRVPIGHAYQVLVSLWHIQKCQWANYSIYDRSFSAVDTVDLRTKNRDTLNLIFSESVRIKYFLGLKNPPGKWTDRGSYFAYIDQTTSTPTFYKDSTLYGFYIMEDLRSKCTSRISFSCDTGRVLISFLPNVMSMLENHGVVIVPRDSVIYGHYESHEDSLNFLPLDDAPNHVFSNTHRKSIALCTSGSNTMVKSSTIFEH